MKQYTDGKFDIAAFFNAIKDIEITDGDYTTDKDINDKKVIEGIYDKIASAVITEAGKDYYSKDKLESGDITEGDIVYFCYFAKDADGNYFMLSDMLESSITASTTKAKHFIKLGNYDEDDGFMAKVAEALLAKKDVKYYSTQTKTDLQKEGSVKIAKDEKIVISYDVEISEGEGDDKKTYKKTADYQLVILDGSSAISAKLVELISTPGAKVNVGDKVEVPAATYNGDTDKTTTTSFDIVEDGITYKYSNFTIDYKIDSYVSEDEAITFKYTNKDLLDAYCDNLRLTSAEKIKLKELELTYYVYPVYRLDLPEVSAESIIEYVYGKNVSTTSSDLFTSEEYKYEYEVTEGENTTTKTKTVKELITTLTNLWKDSYEKGSDLEKLYNVYKDADTAVDKAEKGDALDKAEAALDKAEGEFYVAKRNEIRETIKKIVAAKKGDDVCGEKFYEEYVEDTHHTSKEKYNTDITEKVGKKVWEIIDKQIVVTSYPKDLVEEFADHLYESYEYKFYNENYSEGSTSSSSSTAAVSNYIKYNGVFKDYLIETLNTENKTEKFFDGTVNANNISRALKDKAKVDVKPIIQLYFLAQELNKYNFGDGKTINDIVLGYVESDIAAGKYKAHYEYNDSLSKEENERADAKAKEQADKNKESALKNAKNFLVTDAVFEDYKNEIGKKTYEVWEEQYGEINIRAALQADKIFYYLLSTDIVMSEDGGDSHAEVKYVDRDGKLWLAFRTASYHFPAEKTDN